MISAGPAGPDAPAAFSAAGFKPGIRRRRPRRTAAGAASHREDHGRHLMANVVTWTGVQGVRSDGQLLVDVSRGSTTRPDRVVRPRRRQSRAAAGVIKTRSRQRRVNQAVTARAALPSPDFARRETSGRVIGTGCGSPGLGAEHEWPVTRVGRSSTLPRQPYLVWTTGRRCPAAHGRGRHAAPRAPATYVLDERTNHLDSRRHRLAGPPTARRPRRVVVVNHDRCSSTRSAR